MSTENLDDDGGADDGIGDDESRIAVVKST